MRGFLQRDWATRCHLPAQIDGPMAPNDNGLHYTSAPHYIQGNTKGPFVMTRILHGVVHGRTIELTEAIALPDGQEVAVTVTPTARRLPPGEGIRRTAGAWADDAAELDRYLEWTRQQRKASRRSIDA